MEIQTVPVRIQPVVKTPFRILVLFSIAVLAVIIAINAD